MEVNICNYFSCPRLESWGPRVLRDYELIYVVSGATVYRGATPEALPIDSQQLLLIPPGEEHVFSCRIASVLSCIHFMPDDAMTLPYRMTPEPPECARLHELFRECAREFDDAAPEREELLRTMLREILLRCRRSDSERGRRSPLMRQMLAYIDRNYIRHCDRNVLAGQFKVTPEHVNYCFRRELGMAPSHYINRQRIHRAYQLLLTECRSVKEAAFAVGFPDEYYFARVFKAITGISPGRVRAVRPLPESERR